MPGSVRIRTGDGNEWRYDEIERAADYYDCNRSNAVAFACHDVVELVANIRQVLEREDLTLEQRREIADTLSTGKTSHSVSTDIDVETPSD
ncbi:DUF7692 domain-containing protein [Natrinema salaciae]|uniref:DUF7692 domain-containing protein n=1 Tax=Natrinema salaciae TaxID=1186196 RepID=A0A1H9KCU5_9EURY|nr:hypothetical protein SAMN04489841_2882 [Natrinema salaciae]